MTRLGKERLEAFWRWLDEQGVTVSSLTCGKQELSPASQIPIVDAKWRELFPEASDIPCPVFKHSGDRLPGDIMPLAEVPPTLECERVIFAGQSWTQSQAWTGPVEARFMLSRSEWNGCNHMPIAWDGTLASALDAYLKTLEGFREEYASAMTPNPQWLTVTVDYHS